MEFRKNISYDFSMKIFTSSLLIGVLLCVFIMTIKWIKKLFCFPICFIAKFNRVNVEGTKENFKMREKNESILNSQQITTEYAKNLEQKTRCNKKEKNDLKTRVSYVNVRPKYMYMDRTSPKFKNYLQKSNKPFLGYMPQEKGRERSESYF